MTARINSPTVIELVALQIGAHMAKDEEAGRQCRAVYDRLFSDAVSAREWRQRLLRTAIERMEADQREGREPLRTLLEFSGYTHDCFSRRLRPAMSTLIREYHRINRLGR